MKDLSSSRAMDRPGSDKPKSPFLSQDSVGQTSVASFSLCRADDGETFKCPRHPSGPRYQNESEICKLCEAELEQEIKQGKAEVEQAAELLEQQLKDLSDQGLAAVQAQLQNISLATTGLQGTKSAPQTASRLSRSPTMTEDATSPAQAMMPPAGRTAHRVQPTTAGGNHAETHAMPAPLLGGTILPSGLSPTYTVPGTNGMHAAIPGSGLPTSRMSVGGGGIPNFAGGLMPQHPPINIIAMQYQQMQNVQRYMIYQREEECLRLRQEIEGLRKQNQDLLVRNARLSEKLVDKDKQLTEKDKTLAEKDKMLKQQLGYMDEAFTSMQTPHKIGPDFPKPPPGASRPEPVPSSSNRTSTPEKSKDDDDLVEGQSPPLNSVDVFEPPLGPKKEEKSPDKPKSEKKHWSKVDINDHKGKATPYKVFNSDDTSIPYSLAGDFQHVENERCKDAYGNQGYYTGTTIYSTGMPHGTGKMLYDSGDRYDGAWRHGRWHGSGRAYYAKGGHEYIGEFVGSSRHGQGFYKWPDGRVYEGDFQDNKRHGRGRLQYPEGRIEQGIFKHSVLVEELDALT